MQYKLHTYTFLSGNVYYIYGRPNPKSMYTNTTVNHTLFTKILNISQSFISSFQTFFPFPFGYMYPQLGRWDFERLSSRLLMVMILKSCFKFLLIFWSVQNSVYLLCICPALFIKRLSLIGLGSSQLLRAYVIVAGFPETHYRSTQFHRFSELVSGERG